MNIFKKITFISVLIFSSQYAFALNSLINTGSVTENGTYKLGGEFQAITDKPSGANFLFFIDLPTKSESIDYRIKFGTGQTDVNLSAGLKWIPIPDLQKQPAIGAYFDIDWISDNSFDFLTFRASPLVSKEFRWEYGTMTPYAAVPIGMRYILEDVQDEFDFFVQLAFGAELNFEAYENLRFIGEVGLDIDESISYFSLALRYKM